MWTASESPYEINGNIEVPYGESLLIEAGTTVHFTGAYFLRIVGDFSAMGAEADSVTFTWAAGQINYSGIVMDTLNLERDTVRLSYCRISNMQSGRIRLFGADAFIIENSRIYNNIGHASGAVMLFDASGVIIRDTHFHNNSCTSSGYGGAIYMADSSPLIENCTFNSNYAPNAGGAMSIWRYNVPVTTVIRNNHFEDNSAGSGGCIDIRSNCVPLIESNTFINNSALFTGGVIWMNGIQAGVVQFINNDFINNTVPQRGGAIRVINSRTHFEGNLFDSNSTANFGGGAIHMNNSNDASFVDCIFKANSAGSGGAISIEDEAEVNIDRCQFLNNSANFGGAFLMTSYIEMTCSNSLIANNSANNLGGAMRLTQFSDPIFVNCTFANNHATNTASVASLYWDSNPMFINSILHGNTSGDETTFVVQDYIWHYCNPSFSHCLIEGGQAAFNLGTSTIGDYISNWDENPLFVNPTEGSGVSFDGASGDFRLSADDSPGIDSGTLEGYVLLPLDLDGEERLQGEAIDLGCYEGGVEVIDPPHPLDFNGDDVVDTEDFLLFLANFGCMGEDCVGDLNGDGMTGAADLLIFLTLWNG